MQISFEHIYLGDPGIARQRLGVYGKEDIIEIAATIRDEIAKAFNAIPQYVPVGAVLPWLKTLAGTPQTLPSGFVECNGQQIDDKGSLLQGGFVPNLNSTNRFLRGNTTSGATGGSATHTHEISALCSSANEAATVAAGGDYAVATENHSHNISAEPDTPNHEPPYYDVVWIMRIK